jgi:hypothetical protein
MIEAFTLQGKKYISLKEASVVSGFSEDYLKSAVAKKDLDGKVYGKLVYVSEKDVKTHVPFSPKVAQARKTPESKDRDSRFSYSFDARPLFPEIDKEGGEKESADGRTTEKKSKVNYDDIAGTVATFLMILGFGFASLIGLSLANSHTAQNTSSYIRAQVSESVELTRIARVLVKDFSRDFYCSTNETINAVVPGVVDVCTDR